MVHSPFFIIFYWPTYPSSYVNIHAITPMTWYKLPQFAGFQLTLSISLSAGHLNTPTDLPAYG